MKVVFLGTPEFASTILDGIKNNYEVVLVISQPNRVKKKNEYINTPVAEYAKLNNLKLLQPEHIKDIFDELKNINADILITAAYGQYIPSSILNLFKYKLNVHASLLPKRRGGAPIQRALLEGDRVTGVTIMEMAKGLDTGKMYSFEEYEILEEDNSTSLFSKLAIIGKDLLIKSLPDILSGKNQGIEQNESDATFSSNIMPDEEKIDLCDTTFNIINRIRALSYTPGAYILVNNNKIKIFKAHEVENNSTLKPGTVLNTKKEIIIKTKDSAISLDLIQAPGKKMLSGKDFSNGQKIFNIGDEL